MRKFTTLILIFLITIPVTGFGKNTPDKILIEYLKALYSNNLEKTYSYISRADKGTIKRNDFVKQNTLGDPFLQEMAKTIYSLSRYDINKTEINKDNATVDITVTAPDMPKVLAEIFGPFHGPKDMKNPREAARHMLRQYLKKGNVPMAEEKREFTLIREEGNWKILLNLRKKDQVLN